MYWHDIELANRVLNSGHKWSKYRLAWTERHSEAHFFFFLNNGAQWWSPEQTDRKTVNEHWLSAWMFHWSLSKQVQPVQQQMSQNMAYSHTCQAVVPIASSLDMRNNSVCYGIQIDKIGNSYLITNLQNEVWEHLLKLIEHLSWLDTTDKWR